MEESEKCVDSQFWHVCAGNMVQMPPVNSKVFYFPQGHFEQCSENVDLGNSPRFPHCIPCKVSTIKLLADPETDEVFAKIRLVPVDVNTLDSDNDGTIEANFENQDKPLVVKKTLSRSNASGRGFPVPKHCRDVIFRKSERNSDPADQMIHMKDIHGRVWKFNHPNEKRSRHILTGGWGGFVNNKRPMEGDSIIFMRSENDDLFVGIRREKSSRELVKVEDVTGAVSLADSGKPFEVVYWPRAGTPEFCVRASTVVAAKRIPWSRGMRRLQVEWDAYELPMNQNVKRISPWQVEIMELPQDTLSAFSNNPFLGPFIDLIVRLSNNAPAGMQGVRHDAQYGLSSSNLPNLGNIQSNLLPLSFLSFDPSSQPTAPSNPIISKPGGNENMSRLRDSAHVSKKLKKSDNNKKAPKFMLFGRSIHTEEQTSSMSPSSHTILNTVGNTSDGSGLDLNRNDRPEGSLCEEFQTELGYFCKVFTQSEDEILTVDLSSLGSYKELDFVKTAKSLKILAD
ncbi:hypothetical protein DH2020_040058 [Rehmannia glutinosa]|uniref:TF-B3 domain-containing protein n=1 Tax=Rehmannia glutinosa TaxID=99300 RepID=A0ABR0UVN2_REHGL